MTLNLAKVSDTYFHKLFPEGTEPRPKVLLVDAHTMAVISLTYTQSQLLASEVILVELIENRATLTTMKHLECVVYIRPTRESIEHLIHELQNPHYASYSLFVNNLISKSHLEKLAETDEYEAISSVVEIFQDYHVVNDNLFTVDAPTTVDECGGIVSALLAVGRCPVIKHEGGSAVKRLASEILYSINLNSNNNLFDDVNAKLDTAPVLLLLDRRNDPVTPLISPWTYQSMIHELVGIHGNVAETHGSDGPEKVVLSDRNDKFFRESMYMNYGDLTDNFQRHVEKYKLQTQQSSLDNLLSLTELKKVLTRMPEFRKLSQNILKHLNLISELDKAILEQDLWVTGELEQLVVCGLDSPQALARRVEGVLDDPRIPLTGKIRLVLLYTLKFPGARETAQFAGKLSDPQKTSPLPTRAQLELVSKFSRLFADVRVNDTAADGQPKNFGTLFNKNKINSLFSLGSSAPADDNVYMQYRPRLHELLQQVLAGQDLGLHTLIPDIVSRQYGLAQGPVQDVIIYIKGGVTYEEARIAHEISSNNPRVNVMIGGDKILNSREYLADLCAMVDDAPQDNPLGHDRSQLRDLL